MPIVRTPFFTCPPANSRSAVSGPACAVAEASKTKSALRVFRVLKQDDVGLTTRLTHAGDVNRGLILHGTNFLARAAADAERGVDVRALELHRLHRGRLAV